MAQNYCNYSPNLHFRSSTFSDKHYGDNVDFWTATKLAKFPFQLEAEQPPLV